MPTPTVAPEGAWIEDAARAVAAGGIVALPFERLFGLATCALDAGAVARLIEVKGRTPRAPVSVIAAAIDGLLEVAAPLPPLALALARRHWPGPLTLLVPARPGLPPALVGTGGLVGVRVPGPSPALELARAVGRALTATSANRSGEPDARTHLDLLDLDGVDLVVPGAVPGPPGSTVVDASGDEPIVVRRGILRID